MTNGFDNLLDSTGKMLEIAPKLYDDTFSPAAKELGKTIAIVPGTINALLSGVRQWIAHKEYNVAKTDKILAEKLKDVDPDRIIEPEPYVAVPALQAISYSMDNDELRELYANLLAKSAEKLKDVDPDRIIEPEPYVAVPALQAISYSMDNDELRELYANLLAKSMNIDTKNDVHPAFVEVIKQLSPYDAELLKKLFSDGVWQIPKISLRLEVSQSDSNGIDVIKSLLDANLMNFNDFKAVNLSLDNLERLKIIEVRDYYLNGSNLYENIYAHLSDELVNNLTTLRSDLTYLRKIKGSIILTEFGNKFVSIVL